MELFLEILGYGFIFVVLGLLFFVFTKLLTGALGALTKNDD
jgi:hypothetical protein